MAAGLCRGCGKGVCRQCAAELAGGLACGPRCQVTVEKMSASLNHFSEHEAEIDSLMGRAMQMQATTPKLFIHLGRFALIIGAFVTLFMAAFVGLLHQPITSVDELGVLTALILALGLLLLRMGRKFQQDPQEIVPIPAPSDRTVH